MGSSGSYFLNKIKLERLSDGVMLCIIDVMCLYPKIPLGEGLASLRKFLETRDNKQISSDTFMELAEVVLKSKILEFDEKAFKQNHETAIEMKFAIRFMEDFEGKLLERFEKKPMIWWRYIDVIFFIWEHFEGSLKILI